MFNIFRREKSTTSPSFLTLDIGTEFVKALVCEIEGNTVVIRGVGRKRQHFGDMQSGIVMDLGGVIETAGQAIDEAGSEASRRPHDVIMGIAGELVKGMTHRVTHVRKEPEQKIDLNELKNIIHRVQWKSFEETRSQIAYETGHQEIDVKLVNAAIVDVRIDGYRVAQPLGFQGREVHICLFNAFAPLVHFGALQTIAAELDLNLMSITAEPYALARCLEHDENPPVNGIFIDVGGGTTDIAVVRDGTLEGTKMFTLGGRTFSKRIASTLNISLQEAEEIKLAYSRDQLEKQSERIVREAIESDIEVWISGVALTLSEFASIDVFPGKIYLCGGGSLLPEIAEALRQSSWAKDLSFPKAPSVALLLPKQMHGVRDDTKKLTETQDVTPIALAKIGREFIGEEALTGKILKKVIRLMEI